MHAGTHVDMCANLHVNIHTDMQGDERATNERAMNERALNERAMNEWAVNERAMNERAMNEQANLWSAYAIISHIQ